MKYKCTWNLINSTFWKKKFKYHLQRKITESMRHRAVQNDYSKLHLEFLVISKTSTWHLHEKILKNFQHSICCNILWYLISHFETCHLLLQNIFEIIYNKSEIEENLPDLVFSAVPADALAPWGDRAFAPWGDRAFAGTVMTKFRPYIDCLAQD